jgi:hypothetical protein
MKNAYENFSTSTSRECFSEIICATLLVKCSVLLFYGSTLCECSSEVLRASDLVKRFMRVF